MRPNNTENESNSLAAVCAKVKELIGKNQMSESEQIIKQAMANFPHAPEPHNLMGIELENIGDHVGAMKHFRAAWALDPTFLPARYNMNQYAEVFQKVHTDAYTIEDCDWESDEEKYVVTYDEKGIGHVVKKAAGSSFGKK